MCSSTPPHSFPLFVWMFFSEFFPPSALYLPFRFLSPACMAGLSFMFPNFFPVVALVFAFDFSFFSLPFYPPQLPLIIPCMTPFFAALLPFPSLNLFSLPLISFLTESLSPPCSTVSPLPCDSLGPVPLCSFVRVASLSLCTF